METDIIRRRNPFRGGDGGLNDVSITETAPTAGGGLQLVHISAKQRWIGDK